MFKDWEAVLLAIAGGIVLAITLNLILVALMEG